MKKLIKKSLCRLAMPLAGFIALLAAGCATETTPPVPDSVISSTPVSGRPIPNTMAAMASSEVVSQLNIHLTASGGGVAEAVRLGTAGQLTAAGFKLNPAAPDITIAIAVRSTLLDRTGDYFRYEGSAEVSILRSWDHKRLGIEHVSVRAQRGLGADAATANLAAELATATAQVATRILQPAQTGLAASDVTVKRNDLASSDAPYVQHFISTVKAQRGVIYCALVAQDLPAKKLTFRIVYLADALPEGLLNRLVTLQTLQLKLQP